MLYPTLIALMLLTLAGPARAAESELVTQAPPDIAATLVTPPLAFTVEAPRRPALLPVLYVSYAALQVLDARTTAGALSRGAREGNPLLRQQPNQIGIWAVRAATTAGTIYFAERVWKRNRLAAVLVMVTVNSGYAAIAAHNAKLAR